MEERYLHYFVTAVDLGSLSKAAVELGVAQPALSQRIAALEREFDATLLTRSPTGVRATPAGLALYRHARSVLRQLTSARVDVKQAQSMLSGDVIVGMSPPVALVHAGELFTTLRETHSGIRLHLFESVSGYLSELMANGRIDLGVMHVDKAIFQNVRNVQTLYREPLCVIGLPEKFPLGKGDITLAELAAIPLVLPGKSQQMRRLIDRVSQHAGHALNVVGEIDSLHGLFDIAMRGAACAMVPLSILPSALASRPALAFSYTLPRIPRDLSICESAGGHTNDAVQIVRDVLVAQFRAFADDNGDFAISK
jgi:LysR family transcriptional regulator, nitrogen assimilation regulatory protein